LKEKKEEERILALNKKKEDSERFERKTFKRLKAKYGEH
jgi:hypothetical protein